MSHKIYKKLAALNELPEAEAEIAFLDCCGSLEWARRMSEARPFPMVEDIFRFAGDIWFALAPADHLEAFAAHPKIGSKRPAPVQKARAASWSADEQSGMDKAGKSRDEDLAEANRLYEDKFGFIFIVSATGRSADEMLAICRARLGNSLETEFRIAAEEQHKITEIRLTKLLEQ